MKSRSILLVSLCLLSLCAQSAERHMGNLSPTEALKAFETEAGFSVTLVAAEPLTVDPVALAFDERGRLYVAEDRDYPVGAADGKPLGIIALLEDADGDGRMDKRTEFAVGIKFPNGVMPWRGGVIVTASPDVLWFNDTDGDGRADVKEVLLTGLDTNSTSQLRANDPTLGPDGWVYLAGGLRGGLVYSPKQPDVKLSLDKGDVRFKPDTGEMELIDGKSQFGLAFDDAGNRFACMNRIQSQHAPLSPRYLARNPFATSPGALENCPEITENNLLTRSTGGAVRVYPISDNLTTADSHGGTYSAACAVHIYRGLALPADYLGAAFSCDPTANLVRGDRLEKVGGTFAALRIRAGTEALRSRDNWFRPVFLADGPDGALYVADMYRKVIEHPEYLPAEVRKHADFESGKDKGRVWRLSQATIDQSRKVGNRKLNFETADIAGLVTALDSPIPWQRDTGFRLLIERGDKSAVPILKNAFKESDTAGPAVAKLRLLALLGELDDAVLEKALTHPQPSVRHNGLVLAESRLAESPRIQALTLKLADDADPHVRFQAALSLGEIRNTSIVPALARIAGNQASDRWTRAAILSSLRDRDAAFALLGEVAKRNPPFDDGMMAMLSDLGRRLGCGLEEGSYSNAFGNAVRASSKPGIEFQLAAVLGFAEATGSRFRELTRNEADTMNVMFATARQLATNHGVEIGRRVRAIRLLEHDNSSETAGVLIPLLGTVHATEIQTTAARALLQPSRAAVSAGLLSAGAWSSYTPALRTVLLNSMIGRAEFGGALLNAIESGAIPVGALNPSQRGQLRKSNDPELRTRAEKLLTAPGGNREQAFAESKAALRLKPVPSNGHTLFQKNCAVCHRLNQEGVAVGPDLFGIRNQPKESILYHIIVPEAEIAPNFVNYECETKDGRVLSGLLAAESSGNITLRMAQGVEEVISRAQIARLVASRLSLMPQEFEKVVTPQELADLLAYLRGEE